MADQLQNMLGELSSKKQESIDSQLFTYAFRVYVPNKSFHPTNNFPWPGNTPGKARLKFRCEEDANFKIEAVTASVHGPVRWTNGTEEVDQVDKPDAAGATTFPLPGYPDPLPTLSQNVTASAVADEITAPAGGPWLDGMPVLFTTSGAGVLPGGLAKNTLFYMQPTGALTFQVRDAITGTVVDILDAGTAPFQAVLIDTFSVVAATDTFTKAQSQFLTVGQPISFYGHFPDTILPAATFVPARPTQPRLLNGETYYAIPLDATTFKIAETPANAIAGTAIDITSTGTVGLTGLFVMPKAQIAERGVSARIYEQSNVQKNLTNDYAPIDLLFPPGYGTYVPGVSSVLEGHVLPKAHELILDFRNRDVAGGNSDVSEFADNGDWYHVVHIAFTGVKFYD